MTTNDLLRRLRAGTFSGHYGSAAPRNPDGKEAAAEIERLTARASASAAEAKRDRAREALRPFADTLSRFEITDDTLILLSRDANGAKLNYLPGAVFIRARAALGEEG